MKVILKKNIPGLGIKNDIVEVSKGFFMNFLSRDKKAEIADQKKISTIEQAREDNLKKAAEIKEKAKEIAQELKNVTLKFKEKTSSKGKLYAAVTVDRVLSALNKEIKYEIPEENLISFPSIKELGTYKIEVKLSDETDGHFAVKVEK